MECWGAWTWQSIRPGMRNWEGGWRVVRGRVEGRLCWERMVGIEEADTEVMRCVMMPLEMIRSVEGRTSRSNGGEEDGECMRVA